MCLLEIYVVTEVREAGDRSDPEGPRPPHSPSSRRVPPPPPPASPVTRGNCYGTAPDVPRTHGGGAKQQDRAGSSSAFPNVRKRANVPSYCAGGAARAAGEGCRLDGPGGMVKPRPRGRRGPPGL